MENKKLMTLESIDIKNMFEIFNYNIKYPKDENVLIITGPNGFGKTQVLNILFNLFNRKFVFFQNLVFDEITVNLSDGVSIEIIKKEININSKTKKRSTQLNIVFKKKKSVIETYTYSSEFDSNLMRHLDDFIPVSRISGERWVNHRTDQIYSLEQVLEEFGDRLPPEIINSYQKVKSKLANDILDAIDVHLIREQRLFQKVNRSDSRHYSRSERDQNIMTETIQEYSNELKGLINDKIQQSYTISQTLDSSYPNRLINEKEKVSKEEYDKRFADLTEKQAKLTRNGLYESKQKVLGYSKDDSKALLVYLNDLENKLIIFDDLLEKLELFTNILNERRFTFKSIHINRENGFYFKTTKGKELKLNQLSSGEQHEVVLLYELIFKTRPSILVLIDEPEISLHITWQKEFLDDLLRIIKIQNFQVLIATHSPSIINDRWDLVYNLQKVEVND
jgi:predicted ATP-binding protein involved in virulence